MKLYRFGDLFLKIVAVLFTALIFTCTFFFSTHNDEAMSHLFSIVKDNVLINALSLLIFLVCLFFGSLLFKNNSSKRLDIFLYITIGFTFLICEYMAFFGRSMPHSDPEIVYNMAKSIAMGDLSLIHPTQSYMSYYPQQIGICTFLAALIKIIHIFPFSIEEFHFLIAVYGVFQCITVFFMYKVVDSIWHKAEINFCFLLLSLFNAPFYMYTSYLYGEIPALMFISIGAFGLVRFINRQGKTIVNGIIAVIGLTLCVFTRKNSLIIIIAVLIVLIFEAIKEKKLRNAILACLILACSFAILPITVKAYEKISGGTLTTGVTPLSYVAMGMQESETGYVNKGWYTGFNFNTFEESGCDPVLANEKSKAEIKRRMDIFKANPHYALSFYKEKFMTQWLDGTYFSREATYVYYGDRSELLKNIYFGKWGYIYDYMCNIFQVIVYAGSLLWAVISIIRRKDKLADAVLFIGVFGGFLFHMLWEANSRYIFTYACLLVPYAAAGFGNLISLKKSSE